MPVFNKRVSRKGPAFARVRTKLAFQGGAIALGLEQGISGGGMTSRIILIVSVFALVTGCARVSESRFNPLNWFGRGENAAFDGSSGLLPRGYGAEDARPYVAAVSELKIEKLYDGAILRARGITPALGYWDAELIKAPESDAGTLAFQFRMRPPLTTEIVGTKVQRQVDVAIKLSAQDLAGIKRITVRSASNTLATRR